MLTMSGGAEEARVCSELRLESTEGIGEADIARETDIARRIRSAYHMGYAGKQLRYPSDKEY